MTRTPDVTVIVAVYNTMPYLTDCLKSLVKQSIGLERLEIVAVDDGSTDKSGKELDRFAARYPGTFKVIHQANSGGPAAPSNRALEVATGRFVFFIGADDYLGTEALERMVAYADEHESDVVIGRMVGTNGRYAHQALFQKSDPDISLYDSALPFTLANIKLFRRDLVEQHKLRFPEDLPVGSDMPFTLEACIRARKVSVLADYKYYYAVKRGDASNITYRSDHLVRLRCTAEIMKFAAGLIEAGPKQDAVFERHFTWEIPKLVQDDFLLLDPQVQQEVCDGIRELADAYFTDAVRDAIDVKRRVRISLARRGAVAELVRAISSEAERGAPPLLIEDGRAYVRYPGFRDELGLPDRTFEILNPEPKAVADAVRLVSAGWEQEDGEISVAVSVRIRAAGDIGNPVVRLVPGELPRTATTAAGRCLSAGNELPSVVGELTRETDADGAVLHARIPVERRKAKLGVRVYLDVAGSTYEIPVKTQGMPLPLARRWRRDHPYRIHANANPRGWLTITTAPLWEPKPATRVRIRRQLSRLKRKVTR
ncbi:glycosyltransferase [Streptomyces sp. A3M-1-3]|uniref:glycosyltransferase family 2 protein n=1 Tax=Streptomyces sp. A3M-1-3 TaxID=2962044 RepID=UPI0020B7E3A3|nr:glycosyltransferase [Streptomyces sp. A3M-1-3]MCP3817704.1 glycosyltransferase [Streptomyces sp. A3M-1-3]